MPATRPLKMQEMRELAPRSVRAVVARLRLADIKTAGEVGHMAVAAPAVRIVGGRPVGPGAAHRVVDGGEDLHRHFVLVFSRKLAVDVEDATQFLSLALESWVTSR